VSENYAETRPSFPLTPGGMGYRPLFIDTILSRPGGQNGNSGEKPFRLRLRCSRKAAGRSRAKCRPLPAEIDRIAPQGLAGTDDCLNLPRFWTR
jgi:hypothetical protein